MSRRAEELLDAATSRGAIKRLAAQIDREPALREELIAVARARGIELGPDATAWSSKRLLRRARGREAEARIRSNPIARDEDFTCAHCEAAVPAHGRTARDHCPHCLRSLHVDVVPGDRAARCSGILDPVGVERRGARTMIHYRCRSCGHEGVNQALVDGDPPDDWDQVIALPGVQ